MKRIFYLSLLATALLAVSCKKEGNLLVKEEANDLSDITIAEASFKPGFLNQNQYSRPFPAYLRMAGLRQQPVRHEVAALGRVLFYDKNLSRDRQVSCASCHRQEAAFADNAALSTGIEGKNSLRNSMALANVASVSAHYAPLNGVSVPFLWDTRASSIAELSRMAFTDPNEMGMTMPEVVEQVKSLPHYPYIWKRAYGDVEVSESLILEALQEFVGVIGSHNSWLDQVLASAQQSFDMPNTLDTGFVIRQLYYGTDTILGLVLKGLEGFSESTNRGRAIFIANCTKCHSPIRPFQEVLLACNGLEMNYKDAGMAAVTGRAEDAGVFKSLSLRNIALTAPYMHDGRFKSLKDVVEFYSTGVKPHPNLHPLLRRPDGSTRLNLTTEQKNDLIAFLKTLTDHDVAKDSRLTNPFL